MRCVDLDAIEFRFLRPHGRRGERSGRRGDVIERHLLGDDRLVGDLEHRMRNGGGRNRRLAADVDACMAAAMAELDRGLGAAAVDVFDEAGETRQEPIIVDAELAHAMAAGAFRRCHLHGDESGAAAHARHVIGDRVVGNVTLCIGQPRGHRRHDDAVAHFHVSDPRRCQEDVHGRLTPPSLLRRPCRSWRRAASGRAARR